MQEDEYESKQMPGVGAMLYRHKVTSPLWAVALTTIVPSLPLVFLGIASLLGGRVLPGAGLLAGGLALAALLGFLMVAFATARIAVSEGEIHLQLGMAGPKIPIEQVERVLLAPSGINRMGMGVRKDFAGTTYYTLWGDNARAVHLTLRDGKKLVLICKEPEKLLAAIEEALARRAQGTGVRASADGQTSSEPAGSHEQASAEAQQRRGT